MPAAAYDYDANDFAVECVSYTPGVGIGSDWLTYYWQGVYVYYNNPLVALGRPTIDTTGDKVPSGWGYINYHETAPVVNVYPACRTDEVVSIGYSGQITLKFNHPVADDENNPYGIDLIVFGNARKYCNGWDNRDPATFLPDPEYAEEFGIVSVSPDGQNWYTYEEGPFADNYAPTLGRVYDPANADTSIGAWNHWWGEPTDPTLPLNPSVTIAAVNGKTVAQTAILYGKSAGGTGFDIAQSGFTSIQYVKIESNGEDISEVDAISDVSSCGDYKHPFPAGDFCQDCIVDFRDLVALAQRWQGNLQDYQDLNDLSNSWLECTWQCEN